MPAVVALDIGGLREFAGILRARLAAQMPDAEVYRTADGLRVILTVEAPPPPNVEDNPWWEAAWAACAPTDVALDALIEAAKAIGLPPAQIVSVTTSALEPVALVA